MTRPLRAIAFDIIASMEGTLSATSNTRLWTAPYVDAMGQLDTLADTYGEDSAESIVRYFLANAEGWRGEHARRLKAELRTMLAAHRL